MASLLPLCLLASRNAGVTPGQEDELNGSESQEVMASGMCVRVCVCCVCVCVCARLCLRRDGWGREGACLHKHLGWGRARGGEGREGWVQATAVVPCGVLAGERLLSWDIFQALRSWI